jgi:hypothetical protein
MLRSGSGEKSIDIIPNAGCKVGKHQTVDCRLPNTNKTSASMATDSKIDRRDDVRPTEGEHKYGDVEFADPTNKKYPIDTPEHVRAAWNYINHKDNAAKYDSSEVKTIKERIKKAAEKHDVTIDD